MADKGGVRFEDLRWNPEDDTVMHVATGRRLSERDFKAVVSGLDSGDSGVGPTTLSRALVARHALQSDGFGKSDLDSKKLEDIQPGGRDVDGTSDKLFALLKNKQLFYSQPDNFVGDRGPNLHTILGSSQKLEQALAERQGY